MGRFASRLTVEPGTEWKQKLSYRPPPEFHASTLISLGGLPAQLHLNMIICKVKLSRFFFRDLRGVRRFRVLLDTIGPGVFSKSCASLTNCVFFANQTETGRDVSSPSRGEPATNLSPMGDKFVVDRWCSNVKSRIFGACLGEVILRCYSKP